MTSAPCPSGICVRWYFTGWKLPKWKQEVGTQSQHCWISSVLCLGQRGEPEWWGWIVAFVLGELYISPKPLHRAEGGRWTSICHDSSSFFRYCCSRGSRWTRQLSICLSSVVVPFEMGWTKLRSSSSMCLSDLVTQNCNSFNSFR